MLKMYAEIAVKSTGFREVVSAWLLQPKSCCDGKHALLVLLVGGVCKFDLDYVSEVRG